MAEVERESKSDLDRPSGTPSHTGEAGATTPTLSGDDAAELGSGKVRPPSPMSPLVAAFEAGRLSNRLRFHLEQAWFGYGYHRRAARRVAKELGHTVRYLVPAAERRGLQEALTRPILEMLKRTGEEWHHDAYEDWTGEWADPYLTDDDFLRALQPVNETLESVIRLIEKQLDGVAHIAFDFGKLLDRGACPADVHRLLRKPRLTQNKAIPSSEAGGKRIRLKPGVKSFTTNGGRPEDELQWGSVMPGEVAIETGWDREIQQFSIELAAELGLSPNALAAEESGVEESTVQRVDRIAKAAAAGLAAFERREQGRKNDLASISTVRSPLTEING